MSAVAAGKHVLVEKPMTMTPAEARELAAAAETAGVFLMEAIWTRFNPTIRRVQELVASGEVGEVRTVHANFGLPFPFDPESRLWKADLGGGTVLDQGIYPVTIAYLMFGRPSVAAAHGTIGDTGVDYEASMLLGYPNGQQALLGSSMTTLVLMSASIGGTKARIEIDPPFWCPSGYRIIRPPNSGDHIEMPVEGRGYVPMLRAVSSAILDGRRDQELHPNADAVAVMEILDEILRKPQ